VRVELVFVRPGTDYELRTTNFVKSFPALLMVGYANLPDDFASDEPAFRTFLSEIEIDGRRGFQPTKAEPPGSAPSAAASGSSATRAASSPASTPAGNSAQAPRD
jgi:hypothetical protein